PLRRGRVITCAFLKPGAQSGGCHRRVGAQALPQRVLGFGGPWMVLAVVLIDHTKVDAVVVAAGTARQHTAGEQRTVVRAVLGAVCLDHLGRDVPTPGLAVHVSALGPSELAYEQAPYALGVLDCHPRTVAAAPVRRTRPGIALLDHHRPAVQ